MDYCGVRVEFRHSGAVGCDSRDVVATPKVSQPKGVLERILRVLREIIL